MSMRMLILSMLGAVALSACGGEVFNLVCTNASAKSEQKGAGYFAGVKPIGFQENFASWSEGRATSSLITEKGETFIRFVSQNSSVVQFYRRLDIKLPAIFRLTVRSRTRDGARLRFAIRQLGAPYAEFGSGNFGGGEWADESVILDCPQNAEGDVALFLYPSQGVTELASIRLETVPESFVTALVKRPPKTTREYIAHTRFPLGLPSRWNEGRENPINSISEENGALRFCPFGKGTLYSEPFQTIDAESANTVTVRYRAPVGKDWRMAVVNDHLREVATIALPPSGEARTVKLEFRGKARDIGYALSFQGHGCLCLEEVHAYPGKERNPGVEETSEVALAMVGGELCENCRLAFADEKAKIAFACMDAPKGSTLKIKAYDIYGRERQLEDRAAAERGELEFEPFPDARLGQFRVEAWIERDGKRLSPVEEMVFTRLERPLYWGRDAVGSHFGGHMSASERIIDLSKASGVNWTRFHDAGTELSGWYAVESEKGKMSFPDREIDRYRRRKMMIFAQMGTTPAWASHFHEMKLPNFGYFERYMRPKNNDDFIRYVKAYASHYRGVIGHYFFWNEPWGPWWVSGKDAEFYDPKRTMNDFAELTRRVYTALKEVDENNFFVGYNSNEGKIGEKWTKGLTDDDVFNHCDAIDYHIYTSKPRLVYGVDSSTSGSTRQEIERKHPNLGGKAMWMSEGQGTSEGCGGVRTHLTGMYQQIPWGAETRDDLIETADFTARYTISILAEGVEKVFLYSQHAWCAMISKPSYLALVGADGYVGISNASHAHMARMLEDRKFVSARKHGANGGCWRFEGRGGVCEVYDALTAEEMLALTKIEGAAVTDLFGNRLSRSTVMPKTVVYVKMPLQLRDPTPVVKQVKVQRREIKVAIIGEARMDKPKDGVWNVRSVVDYWQEAMDREIGENPDLVVLPEAIDNWNDVTPKERADWIRHRGDAILTAFKAYAKRYHCYLVYNSPRQRSDGRFANTTWTIDRDGDLVAFYDKAFMTPQEMDPQGFRGVCGDKAVVVDTDFGRLGFVTCFDLNFTHFADEYRQLRPDVMVFCTYYDGNYMRNYWASRTQAYLIGCTVGSTLPKTVTGPSGENLLHLPEAPAYDRPLRRTVTAKINTNFRVIHYDGNYAKLRAAVAKYGKSIYITDPTRAGTFTLYSADPELPVDKVVGEFKMETWREYYDRTIRLKKAL